MGGIIHFFSWLSDVFLLINIIVVIVGEKEIRDYCYKDIAHQS